MGKAFESELDSLDSTLSWALAVGIDRLRTPAQELKSNPLIAVGAGGSFTAAKYLELLHRGTSPHLSKAVTPLEFLSMGNEIRGCSVVILSAGGNNRDVLRAAEHAIVNEPRTLLAICTRAGSKLETLSRSYPLLRVAEFEVPSGSDGFLATHSLVATSVILGRLFDQKGFDSWQWNVKQFRDELLGAPRSDSWIAIHSGWGTPAAFDFESKCSEAALGHVLLTDFRNFGHGRHQWLSKRTETSAVVAFYTPAEAKLARRTLEQLPKGIEVVELSTETENPAGMIELLIRQYNLVRFLGLARKIDPGRPGVPKWGRNLYHLPPPPLSTPLRKSRNQVLNSAINRKSGCVRSLIDFEVGSVAFLKRLEISTIRAVVFDFDGTLCDTCDRFDGMEASIGPRLERLLESGIAIGIATGRGSSARTAVTQSVAAKFHKNILIGYYNGSQIGTAEDTTLPNKNLDPHPSLVGFLEELKQSPLAAHTKIELRPHQISVEPVDGYRASELFERIEELVLGLQSEALKIIRSGHSLDVTPKSVSKLAVVKELEKTLSGAGAADRTVTTLSLGDRGDRHGNDYEMLSIPLSLSVDTISRSPDSCWNLAPPGCRNVAATKFYLECLLGNPGRFELKRGIEFWKRGYE